MTAVVQGRGFICTLKNGSAYCQGSNSYGQLGNNTTTTTYYYTANGLSPISAGALVGGNTGITQVAAGEYHACALQNGSVYCWGYNVNGQLGDNTTTTRLTAIKVADGVIPGGNTGITSIAAGGNSTCALKAGSAFCWGYNAYGQLGDGTAGARVTPVALSAGVLVGGNINITQISMGQYYTCAVQNGMAYCWGYNGYGQLGDSSTTDRNTPVKVANGAIS